MTTGDLLSGGFGLLRRHLKAVGIWAALYLALAILAVFAMRPFMTSMAALQRTPNADPAAIFSSMLPGLGSLALVMLAFLLLIAAIFAAAVRAVDRSGDDAFGFLRFGMDELRLIGLGVLYVLAFFAFEIVAILAVALLTALGTLAGPAISVALVAVGGLAALGVLIWLQVRLSLVGALTVMRGRFAIGEGWRATHGHFWALLGAMLVLLLAYIVLMVVVIGVTNPAMISFYSGDMRPDAAAAMMQAQAQGITSPVQIVQQAFSAILTVAFMAITFGTLATAAVGREDGLATIFE